MARRYLKAYGSGTIYTVPANKIAKIIIKRVLDWTSSQYSLINIGAFSQINELPTILNSAQGNVINSTTTNSLLQSAEGYLMCSGSDASTKSINLKSEHIILAGETVYIANGTLYITIIEEDI